LPNRQIGPIIIYDEFLNTIWPDRIGGRTMADSSPLDQRLAALEREVAEMKRRLPDINSDANWVDEFAGSMKEFPEFEKVVQFGREFRESQTDPAS
jgi:hypothetical protein